MHRVELKEWVGRFGSDRSFLFLMHRVELKASYDFIILSAFSLSFLMHRVELKAVGIFGFGAPCPGS